MGGCPWGGKESGTTEQLTLTYLLMVLKVGSQDLKGQHHHGPC